MDDNGHGTHCAGIASAVTDNAIGIAGVCWNCRVMSLKFLDLNGYGSTLDGARAIEYAADNGAEVISMSWGCNYYSDALKDALYYAYARDATLLAAAGNGNTNEKSYPAGYSNVIAIAATDSNDERAGFSNYGCWINICAPGVNIYSAILDNAYDSKSGTSMACPYVSGLAGLVISQNPGWGNNQVRGQVIYTADNLDSLNT